MRGGGVDVKEDIKRKFKFEMLPDFYDLWDFCKDLKPGKPTSDQDYLFLFFDGERE